MYRTVPNAPKASTLKKSQAHSVSQWLFMNRFHVRFFSRSGAGSIPSVVRPISIFNPRPKSVADFRVTPAQIRSLSLLGPYEMAELHPGT